MKKRHRKTKALRRTVQASEAQALKPFELQATASVEMVEAREGAPKQPTVEMTAYTGGAMRVDFWPAPVVVDLSKLRASKRVALLLNHDRSKIVGQGKAEVGRRYVRVSGLITGDTDTPGQPAQEVVSHARRGFKWPVSIGVGPERATRVAAGETVNVNGMDFSGPLFVVEGRLGEVSFVSYGADADADARVAAAAPHDGEDAMNFEAWLKAKFPELDPEKISDEQKKALQAAWKSEQKSSDSDPDPSQTPKSGNGQAQPVQATIDNPDQALSEMRNRYAQEADRVAKIDKLFASNHAELKAKAISEGWSFEKAENEFLKAENERIKKERPNLTIHAPGTPERTGQAIQAALCTTLGLPKIEKQFDEKTLDASQKLYRNGMSLQELLIEAAVARGHSGARRISAGNYDSIMRAISTGAPVQAASGFSTYNIAGLLSETANKFLLASFNAVESVWRAIAAIGSVSDFKTVNRYRLTGNLEFEPVAPAGELKHGTVGDETFTNKASTQGKILAITREDIINDDLGALQQIPARLGRGGALKLNKDFWTEFLDNASFFTAGRGNFKDGAATALSLTALGTANTTFRKLVDPDGDPLAIMPRILLVPVELEQTGEELYEAREVRDTTASTKYPTVNTFRGKFTVQSSFYLSLSTISGNSAKAWYLLADPADLATIEVVFLNGQQTPVIQTSDADFNVLGIMMRGYFDYGVKKQDWRAGVKMKGEA